MPHVNRRSFLQGSAQIAGYVCLGSRSLADSESDPSCSVFSPALNTQNPYDLVVCGGGPSGIAASLAAARAGMKVLLVDANAQLGGMCTSGHVCHWLGGRSRDASQWVVGGIFKELAQDAVQKGAAILPSPPSDGKLTPHGWSHSLVSGIPVDPFALAPLLDEKIAEAGIELLLCTQAVHVLVEKSRITHVILVNKSGFSSIPARAVIDATGDADIAARSGCEVVKGRDSDHLMTPASLTFHVYNVDRGALDLYIHQNNARRFREEIQTLREQGEWPFPYDIFISVQLVDNDVFMINTTRLVGIDGTNGASITAGLLQGRKEIQQLLQIMRKHFAGFQNAKIKSVAPALGIRETRRIQGDFQLTVNDLVEGKSFDDTIGFSSYGWDLPDPQKPSYQPMSDKKVELQHPFIPIPYRIMIPRPVENLLCPGRAVSVERDVLGPLRGMAPCFAMGQAAGSAAIQAVRDNISFRHISIPRLIGHLRENHAIVNL